MMTYPQVLYKYVGWSQYNYGPRARPTVAEGTDPVFQQKVRTSRLLSN